LLTFADLSASHDDRPFATFFESAFRHIWTASFAVFGTETCWKDEQDSEPSGQV